jgi:hypothetical protein
MRSVERRSLPRPDPAEPRACIRLGALDLGTGAFGSLAALESYGIPKSYFCANYLKAVCRLEHASVASSSYTPDAYAHAADTDFMQQMYYRITRH